MDCRQIHVDNALFSTNILSTSRWPSWAATKVGVVPSFIACRRARLKKSPSKRAHFCGRARGRRRQQWRASATERAQRAQRSEVGTSLDSRALRCSFSSNSLCNRIHFTNTANPLKIQLIALQSAQRHWGSEPGSCGIGGIRLTAYCRRIQSVLPTIVKQLVVVAQPQKNSPKNPKTANSPSDPPQLPSVPLGSRQT